MICCCGLTTLDVTQTVDRVPGPDEKVTGRGLEVDFGGPAANAAAVAVALGVPARLVTAIGSGALGHVVRARLEAAGVEVVDLLEGQDVDPPVSTVLVTAATGERAVVSVNDTRARELAPVPEGVLEGVGTLLLDGWLAQAAAPLAWSARGAGLRVLLDGGSVKPGTAEILASCEVAVLSADFHLPEGDDLALVAALGPRLVARSAGPGPVEVLEDGVRRTVPVRPAARVVDTLGAGDVLHGALAAAWDRWPGEAFAALAFATRVATASVEHPGARGWARDEALRGVLARELATGLSVL